ncbi:AbrB family transcriptional regulator [Abyssicoccus albus]|uniref:AbrB family transcriptional regulator n=1 Tax=Abyssicoccus albus TaxID=1817405 RepID=UPI00097E16D5|nr:AbrB family transcriptional regulator [Abyssicoccus albus]AQL55973.1 hypothetical protein BVH56_03070 [Abyssicoccus albus]
MQNKWVTLTILFMISFVLSYIADQVGMILPYMFTPILLTVFFISVLHWTVDLPNRISNVALYILGIQIGTSFTLSVIVGLTDEWLGILIITIAVMVIAMSLAVLFKKLTHCTLETAILSTVPGALSQMIVMAEEDERADLLLVTLAQTTRIVMVILLVPIISTFIAPKQQSSPEQQGLLTSPSIFELPVVEIIMIIVCVTIVTWILKRVHFPASDLLGPVFTVLLWNVITNHPFTLPVQFINVAQILFGIRIGYQIATLIKGLNIRMIIAIVIQSTVLVALTFVFVAIYSLYSTHSLNDLFLSAAPGGMAQIVIVAIETGADISMVSSYHIFRIFFILLIITPLVSLGLKKRLT